MEFNNPVEIIMHYFLIRGMAFLGHQDVFPMVSILVYMTTIEHNFKGVMTNGYLVVMTTQTYYVA